MSESIERAALRALPRYLSQREYAALKAAFRELVRTVGGSRAAERITRVSHQQIDRYGSTDHQFDDVFAPIDVIADLEAECKAPIVTRMLAELSGQVLLPLPATTTAPIVLDLLTAKAIEKFGVMLGGVAEAKADGVVTSVEAAALRPQLRDVLVKLMKLDQELVSIIENGEPS